MNGLLELRLGWNIRKVIGGGGSTKKKFMQGRIERKNSRTASNPEKCYRVGKNIPAKEM